MDLIQRKGAVTERKRGVGLKERVRGTDKIKKESEREEEGGGGGREADCCVIG